MAPRAIWTGSVSFGLVNVPVRMYSAIQEHTLHFHYLHVKDDSRIGYEKVCKQEGKPVPDDEIVKAFEYEKGEFVYMTDEDFDTAAAEAASGLRTIDIRDFVPYEEVDPILFRRTYYLGPQEGGEKVYALLVRALEQSGLAGVAKYVMRDRQNLGLLRVRDGVLTLEQMYFADEIRPMDAIKPEGVKVEKRELEMAEQLIDAYSGAFDPAKYKDTYRDALCEIIKAKREGEEIHRPEPEEEEAPPDLLAALRASVEAASKGRRGKRAARSNGGEQLDYGLPPLSRHQRAPPSELAAWMGTAGPSRRRSSGTRTRTCTREPRRSTRRPCSSDRGRARRAATAGSRFTTSARAAALAA
jgi:DNA end-binding protein Ku